jgi:hypothetical protein
VEIDADLNDALLAFDRLARFVTIGFNILQRPIVWQTSHHHASCHRLEAAGQVGDDLMRFQSDERGLRCVDVVHRVETFFDRRGDEIDRMKFDRVVPSGDAAPIQLAISPSVEHSQWSAVDQHGTIVLPSPRISGMYDTVDDETARLLSLNRSHWGVENGLHYRRDETLREDWCHLKGGHAPRAMAVINNLIVGLVLHLKWTNLAEARRYYDAHPREAQHLVMRRLL